MSAQNEWTRARDRYLSAGLSGHVEMLSQLSIPCEKCGAPPGAPCRIRDSNSENIGHIRYTSFHGARRKAARGVYGIVTKLIQSQICPVCNNQIGPRHDCVHSRTFEIPTKEEHERENDDEREKISPPDVHVRLKPRAPLPAVQMQAEPAGTDSVSRLRQLRTEAAEARALVQQKEAEYRALFAQIEAALEEERNATESEPAPLRMVKP